MSTSRRLLSGTFFRTAFFFTQIAVIFLMTPMIVRLLGLRMYGSWILITNCIAYTALIDLGLSSGVARYISRAVGKGDEAEVNRVISTALRLFLFIGLGVLLLTLVGEFLCLFLIKDAGEARALGMTTLCLGARLAFKFPTRAFDGVLTSHLRYDLQVTAAMTGFLSSYALIFYALRNGHGIAAMAAAMLACSLVEYILVVAFARRVHPGLKIGRTLQSEDVRKSLFSYSWKTVVWQVANTLRSKVDAPVIAAFLGRSAIAPYNIGASLNTYFYDFVTTFIGNLSPLFSRYEGKGDFAAIREKFLMMTRIASVVSIFGGASIIFYSRDFILRWMGAGFVGQLPYHASYVVATILACGYTLTLMQTPTSSLFYGLSKHHYGAFLTLGEGLLNLALSLALVKRFGIYGVAWGTTIGLVVSQVFIYPVVACRVVQMPWWKFYAEIGWLAVKTCALLGGWFWLMKNFLRPDYLTLASLGFAQTLLFVPLAYFFILQRPEKEQLAAVLAKWRGR